MYQTMRVKIRYLWMIPQGMLVWMKRNGNFRHYQLIILYGICIVTMISILMDKDLSKTNIAFESTFAQLTLVHCTTYYLKEETRRLWWMFQLYTIGEAIWSNIHSRCVFLHKKNIVHATNTCCYNKLRNPHLGLVVVISIIGSAHRSECVKLHHV